MLEEHRPHTSRPAAAAQMPILASPRSVRPDSWTALHVLAKPSGPPLDSFLAQNKAAMYDEGSPRVRSGPSWLGGGGSSARW